MQGVTWVVQGVKRVVEGVKVLDTSVKRTIRPLTNRNKLNKTKSPTDKPNLADPL